MAPNTIILNLNVGMIEKGRIYSSIFMILGILILLSILLQKIQTCLDVPNVKITGKQF